MNRGPRRKQHSDEDQSDGHGKEKRKRSEKAVPESKTKKQCAAIV
jgi:hypothetical protein